MSYIQYWTLALGMAPLAALILIRARSARRGDIRHAAWLRIKRRQTAALRIATENL